MSLSFYSELFRLDQRDREELSKMTAANEDFVELLTRATMLWRERLRPLLQSEEQCREMLISHVVRMVRQHCVGKERPGIAFAFYLADQVQEIVRECDEEDLKDAKRN